MANHRFASFRLAPGCRLKTRTAQRFEKCRIEIFREALFRRNLIFKVNYSIMPTVFRLVFDGSLAKLEFLMGAVSRTLPSQKDAKWQKLVNLFRANLFIKHKVILAFRCFSIRLYLNVKKGIKM